MKLHHRSYFSFVLGLGLVVLASFSLAQDKEKIKGNGNIKKESRDVSGFDEIATSGTFKVYIKQGSGFSVQVESDDNILPYIVTELKDGSLGIYTRKGYSIDPTKPVNVFITLKELKELASSGRGGFYSDGKIKTDKLELSMSGSLETDLDLEATKLEVHHSGSGNLKLKGKAEKFEIAASGSCNIDAQGLATQDTEIAISGSGAVKVHADKKLEIAISGTGSVVYTGNASVSQAVSGRGTVKKQG